MRDCFDAFVEQFLYYHTVKVVQIRSKRLAFLHYFILAIIFAYVVGWAIIYKKGYQEQSHLIGNNQLKIKGNAYYSGPNGDIVIWDAQDVVYPPKEPEAIFVTTNYLETPKQSRSICTGYDNTEKCPCTKYAATANGINTGTCNNTANYCEVYAWCPLENEGDTPANNILKGVEAFTLFIRSTVRFPLWDVMTNNAKGSKPEPNVNLFSVEEMISKTGYKYEDMALQGGAVAAVVNWECNLDHSVDDCQPEINFIRIDDPNNSFSKGYNFRYANYYYLPNGDNNFMEYRDLFKVYGIRFVILLTGQAGKFSIVPLIINIGSGLALLTVATLVSDTITLYLLPDRKFYNKVKFDNFEDPNVKQKKKYTEMNYDEEDGGENQESDENTALIDSTSFR